MANHPCKPGPDVKHIWQLLLPGTAFPACGTQEDATKSGDAAPVNETRNDVRPPSLAPSPSAIA